MIYFTGDTHGLIDNLSRKGIGKVRRKDVLIITGDFGFVWNGSEAEKKTLKKLSRKGFKILFVEGCHDNYDLLSEYPKEELFGGEARRIVKNVYQLLRGEIYEIDGKRLLAFGGGTSDDIEIYREAGCWWKEEEPNEHEATRAMENLHEIGGVVDIIVSHDAPASAHELIANSDSKLTNIVLEYLASHTKFKKWYFGKYHIDKAFPPKYVAVFEKVVRYSDDPIEFGKSKRLNVLKERRG